MEVSRHRCARVACPLLACGTDSVSARGKVRRRCTDTVCERVEVANRITSSCSHVLLSKIYAAEDSERSIKRSIIYLEEKRVAYTMHICG